MKLLLVLSFLFAFAFGAISQDVTVTVDLDVVGCCDSQQPAQQQPYTTCTYFVSIDNSLSIDGNELACAMQSDTSRYFVPFRDTSLDLNDPSDHRAISREVQRILGASHVFVNLRADGVTVDIVAHDVPYSSPKPLFLVTTSDIVQPSPPWSSSCKWY